MSAEQQCLQCYRPLQSDGVTWACKPCGRGGYHDIAIVDGRSIAVRIETYWRPEAELPALAHGGGRRAARA